MIHRSRWTALTTAGALTCALFAAPATTTTEAAWTAREINSATFKAMVLQAPTMTGCTFNPGLVGLGSTIRIQWTAPGNMVFQPATNLDYTLAREDGAGQLLPLTPTGFSTTGPAGGTYTSTISFTTLALGTRYRVNFRSKVGTQWLSNQSSAAHATSPPVVSSTCTVSGPA